MGHLPPATHPRGSVSSRFFREATPARFWVLGQSQSPSKRHHGPGAPSEKTAAGENQTLQGKVVSLLKEQGVEALPKALDKHGDDKSFKNPHVFLSPC